MTEQQEHDPAYWRAELERDGDVRYWARCPMPADEATVATYKAMQAAYRSWQSARHAATEAEDRARDAAMQAEDRGWTALNGFLPGQG
jgi:hypothetical protein